MEALKNQLSVVEKLNPVEIYNTGNIDSVLEKIFQEARSHKSDISTKKGRDEIASLAYKVSRSKTFLDDLGKKLGEDAKKTLDAINSERKKVRDSLDLLKDEVRKPLTEWENAEKERIAGHEAEILRIEHLGVESEMKWQQLGVEILLSHKTSIQDHKREWEEFEARAVEVRSVALLKIERAIVDFQKWKSDQEELERLRAAEAARKQKEHEEMIARAAAEKARREAEEEAARVKAEIERKSKEEATKLEAEKNRIAEEKALAEQQRIKAEERAKAAEQARIDSEKRAAEAAKRAEEDKKAAVEAEKERARREQVLKEAKEKAEQEKREANKRHTAKINNEALKAFVESVGVSEAVAKEIVVKIAQGKIPHVTINY